MPAAPASITRPLLPALLAPPPEIGRSNSGSEPSSNAEPHSAIDYLHARFSVTYNNLISVLESTDYGSAFKQFTQITSLLEVGHELGLSQSQQSITVHPGLQISWSEVAAWLQLNQASWKNVRSRVFKLKKLGIWMDGQQADIGVDWQRNYREHQALLSEVELLLKGDFDPTISLIAHQAAALSMDTLSKRIDVFLSAYQIKLPPIRCEPQWALAEEDVEKINGIARKMSLPSYNDEQPVPNKFLSIQAISQSSFRTSFHGKPPGFNSPVSVPGEGPQIGAGAGPGPGGAFAGFGMGGGSALGQGWRGKRSS
ncbi:hypothetical protein BV20DRAFT_1057469 [Pilatotrama ljubarskyi]|nr:hypothetical protein BV20DRAFT_1057469 [Pilatotrama ljubarskyi]